MKTYEQFASEMSVSSLQAAQDLFLSVYVEGPEMVCASFREGDADHFKVLEVSEL